MKKMKQNQSNLISLVINTAIGVVLWMLTAAVMSWLISADKLAESFAMIIAPVAQGVIAYLITMISFFAAREKNLLAALTPFVYFITQFIVTLLLWGLDLRGIFRGGMAVLCGAALALLTHKMKSGTKKSQKHLRFSR